MKIAYCVFLAMTPCSLVGGYQHFRGKKSVELSRRTWRLDVPPKLRYCLSDHQVVTLKTKFLVSTDLKVSNCFCEGCNLEGKEEG